MGLRPLLLLEGDAAREFAGIETSEPNCVVVGLAPSLFSYEKLTEAMRVLLPTSPPSTPRPLIAIHKGRYFARKDGLAMGPGPFVAALEFATDAKASIVGKPSKEFFHQVVESLGLLPEDCVMIGDDVRDDCGGALNAGLKAYLVRTGKYRSGDETRFADIDLNGTFNSFADAVEHLLQKFD